MKVLLFINGDAPKTIPDLSDYDMIACTDGAFHYLKDFDFPLHIIDFISGDFDSHIWDDEMIELANKENIEVIHTPDQEHIDFYKALELILEKGGRNIDVYGGSGGEQDHFLGNLTVAFGFRDQLNIKFFDDFAEYYFISNHFQLNNVEGKIISLYPFPSVKGLSTQGLKWNLDFLDAQMTSSMLTRNLAIENNIEINFKDGNLLLFISKNKLNC